MLKLKFWRMRNVIIMEVIEQDDSIKRGYFKYNASNGVRIESWMHPNISTNEIQVRGEQKLMDFNLASFQYDSAEEAKEQLSKFQYAIQEYNSILKK